MKNVNDEILMRFKKKNVIGKDIEGWKMDLEGGGPVSIVLYAFSLIWAYF